MKGLEQKPILADLVLIGAGHANIQVMKSFAMKPIGGLRVTLISDKIHAPYSGMLPGFLAGYYDYEQCHFDLIKICQNFGIRFINEKVVGIDSLRQKIFFSDRHELSYDCAAINVGVEPKALTESTSQTLPIKPISTFISKWQALIAELKTKADITKIAVVGGGAAGVEMTLVLMQIVREQNLNVKVHLFHRGTFLVSRTDLRTHKKLLSILQSYGVEVHLGQSFSSPANFDKVLLSSEAQAPHWFKISHLNVDENGFVKVDAHLRVLGSNNLFAAGDCVHFSPTPLKKAGVYAVRQGKVLATNIRKHLLEQSDLQKFKPKKNVLSLIVVGPKKAIAQQGALSLLSYLPPALLWKLKNWIDLQFMQKFSSLSGPMGEPQIYLPKGQWSENICGGCGSKVGGSVLRSAFKKLGLQNLNDDAALISISKDNLCLQSIDQFRSFISDPFLFAEISVHHAFSDIYAMGGTPTNLLVGLSLPPATEKIQREDIVQTMSGILKGLKVSGAQLVGGHTNESAELSLALSVQGEIKEENILRKTNLTVGDHLILTKPLGAGVILAGQMKLKVSGWTLKQAVEHMRFCNGFAVPCLHKYGVKSCTDVTGFGFAGHLNEMLADTFGAKIIYSSLPTMAGAQNLFNQGLRSSISYKNREMLGEKLASTVTDGSHPFLFDPQTSGGLLFSISANKSKDCVSALRELGYSQATIVGEVVEGNVGITVI